MANKKRLSKNKKKTELVGFVVNSLQKEEIEKRAKDEDLSVSEYIRKIVFSEQKI